MKTREGPVQFERDTSNAADPFHIDEMIREVTGAASGSKKHGLQQTEESSPKRVRADNGDY